jgi:hypothetical protein
MEGWGVGEVGLAWSSVNLAAKGCNCCRANSGEKANNVGSGC